MCVCRRVTNISSLHTDYKISMLYTLLCFCKIREKSLKFIGQKVWELKLVWANVFVQNRISLSPLISSNLFWIFSLSPLFVIFSHLFQFLLSSLPHCQLFLSCLFSFCPDLFVFFPFLSSCPFSSHFIGSFSFSSISPLSYLLFPLLSFVPLCLCSSICHLVSSLLLSSSLLYLSLVFCLLTSAFSSMSRLASFCLLIFSLLFTTFLSMSTNLQFNVFHCYCEIVLGFIYILVYLFFHFPSKTNPASFGSADWLVVQFRSRWEYL